MKINLIPQDAENLKRYCIRTEPNRESIAVRHLSTWIDADNIYMPQCERYTILETTKIVPDPDNPGKTKIIATGSQRIKGPILRGYLFILVAMSPRAANEIANTAGVLQLMPNNFSPQPLTDEEFERLQTSCQALESSSAPEEDYQWMIGKTLRVVSGTYMGFGGECCDIVRSHAILKLEMFKTIIPVPVPVECIEQQSVTIAPKEPVEQKPTNRYNKLIKSSRKRHLSQLPQSV